jgi:BirA family biotin operon repressor/biotin-[acetyl-CoA-carboxylase] ligase
LPEPSFTTLWVSHLLSCTVDSTNNYAFKQIHAGLTQHGTGYFAREQMAGKGQRGKTWSAAKDSSLIWAGLTLTTIIDPTVSFSACGPYLFVNFSKYAGDSTRIKWPNDLYWQDRKAGVLIENIIGLNR